MAKGDYSYPGKTDRWVNVYNPNPGLPYELAGHQGHTRDANLNIRVSIPHRNSSGMYRVVEDEVLSALRCSGEPESVQDYLECAAIQGYLGTQCGLTWKIEDNCRDGQGLHFRFFEYHRERSDAILWVWPERDKHYSIQEGARYSPVDLRNCGIGKLVCYGARTENRDQSFGVGYSGKDDCEGCCRVCTSTELNNNVSLLPCS